MATHTVYGCLKDDGSIEFADTESGCESATVTGCLVTSGEHAGEIEVTHSGCDDPAYACYDPTTGKFAVEIDDNCCIEMVAGTCCGTSTIPKYLEVTISGVTACEGLLPCDNPCPVTDWANDTFILPYKGSGCNWYLCLEACRSSPWRWPVIKVSWSGTSVTIRAALDGFDMWEYNCGDEIAYHCAAFAASTTASGTACDSVCVVSNQYDCEDWDDDTTNACTCGEGGTATIRAA